jgi:hypothetical protein
VDGGVLAMNDGVVVNDCSGRTCMHGRPLGVCHGTNISKGTTQRGSSLWMGFCVVRRRSDEGAVEEGFLKASMKTHGFPGPAQGVEGPMR